MGAVKTGYGPSTGPEIDLQDQRHLLGSESSSSRPVLEPYRDLEEPDDNPPAYSDTENPAPTTIQHRENTEAARAEVGSYYVPGGKVFFTSGGTKSYTITHDPGYSTEPDELFDLIATRARLPPDVSVAVRGTHTVTTSRDGKTSQDTVTDFSFRVDGTDTILPPLSREELRGDYFENVFRELSVVEDLDHTKAYRGGRIKKKITPQGRFPIVDFEQPNNDGTHRIPPKKYYKNLYMWCHRFCEDKARLKSFTLHRELLNWNFPLVEQEVLSVVRSTNYRGSITVKPYMGFASITIRSPCLINTLRANSFVWWACVILQLWIITWPIIFFMERRYEIVHANYYVFREGARSNPLSSELAWVERFSPAIRAAALGRRKDEELVTLSDVDRARGAGSDGPSVRAEDERRARVARGEASFSDSMVDVVRGVADVGRQWNQSVGWEFLGWGGDE